jgi:hypothetical protein
MNCPTCGTVLADGSPFCSTCGANLSNAAPPGMPQMPFQQNNPYAQPMMVQRTSGMAIAGFVLAFFCSLLGLIFSIIGYSECKKSFGQVKGEGLALAGIIISVLSMIFGVMWAVSRNSHHY